MSRNSKAARRRQLLARDPHCANCGVEVVYFKARPHETLPDNFATLEHVNSRNQAVPRPLLGHIVLWCWRCNQDRCEAEMAAMARDEIWRRSGRLPQALR
jgi:hypothetical protein